MASGIVVFRRCFTRYLKSCKLNSFDLRFYSEGFSRRAVLAYSERDPAPYFFDNKVQNILKNITGLDLEKVYKPRQMRPTEPQYKFVSTEELEKLLLKAKDRTKSKLQMPPVLQERKPINEVLSRDPELKGYENHKLLFTDVSYGISDRVRLIVARDPDGTLRKATWDERDRMIKIFFPKPSRRLTMPKVFEDDYLEKVLNRKEYLFILDRACAQFEPDDPNYIRVTTQTYDHVDSTKSFHDLRSTRHFGPMAFYLTFHKKLDNLILDMIERELIDNITDLIQLFYVLHPESKQLATTEQSNQIELIEAFVKEFTNKSMYIVAALQRYTQLLQERQQTSEGIKRAHGYSD